MRPRAFDDDSVLFIFFFHGVFLRPSWKQSPIVSHVYSSRKVYTIFAWCFRCFQAGVLDRNIAALKFPLYNIVMEKITFRTRVKKAPRSPGVYYFSAGRKIVYIGKAENLRDRLCSYAHASNMHTPAKEKMLENSTGISWDVMPSAIEALIEEARLIKKHRPKFNVLLRDDKNYFFVAYTKELFPKIFVTHQRQTTTLTPTVSRFVGPFTDGRSLKSALYALRKIFPFCTCRETHRRPCARAEIGACLGVCCLSDKTASPYNDTVERKTRYKKHVRIVIDILSGKRASVLQKLERAMRNASVAQDFERAIAQRDQFFALQNIFAHRAPLVRDSELDNQKALCHLKILLKLRAYPERIEAYDISNFSGTNATGSMVVFIDGKPQKNAYRKFNIARAVPNDTGMMKELLMRRLRHREWPYPDLIIVDGGKGQLGAARLALASEKLSIPVAALAKREEELHLPARKAPYPLRRLPSPLLHFAQHIRNEAHRFAIAHHRRRRTRTLLGNSVAKRRFS